MNYRLLPSLATALLLLLGATSCEKKDEDPAPVDPYAEPAPVPVLREGAAFTQYLSKLIRVGAGVGGQAGSLGFYDFSIDNSNQLHLLYWTGFQSQQDYIKSTTRGIYNLSTKAPVPLPAPDNMLNGTYAQGFGTQVLEYLPYTGKVAAFLTTGQRTGFYAQGSWGGYLTSTPLPMAPASFAYSGGVGFYNVFTDHGTNKNYMTVHPSPTSPVPLMHVNLEYQTPAMQGAYLANFPEPRYSAQGLPVAITVAANRVEAYKFTYGSPGNYTRTGQLTPSGYTSGQNYTTQRHYNASGTQMAMLVRGETTKRCWTYTYNFATDALAAVVSDADLPYSAAGSDIDLDENGNIYYTGVAGNGTKNGVSVYKRAPGGTTLVGTDDFLKFGEVVKLHYLNGKVHMAIQGNVTGREPWSQFCFVSLN